MIGQLFIIGISGITLTPEESDFIEKNNIGGVILFSHNYESPAQLADLVNSIQALRDEYPLFISVDQEGGRVQRFKEGFTRIPAMLNLAKLDSPKICFEVHKIIADELNSCGINLNFSPCVDILSNPKNTVIGDRAFGNEESGVSKLISAAIRGQQTNGILACAKHFPGHGDTSKDSHFDLPVVKTSIETLKSREFKSFNKAAKARVEFIMMGHLVVDAIDDKLPCTLSENAYRFLRDELRFSKLIITDDMDMKAITDHFPPEESAVMALNAGADLLIYRTFETAKFAYESINQALKTKKIANQKISDKFDRVMECKKNHLKEYKPIYIPNISDSLNTKTTQAFMKDLAGKLST